MNIKPSLFILSLALGLAQPVSAQRVLSLDSCRALALRGNKSLVIARINRERTAEQRKSARTQYLPKVDGVAAYSLSSKEISLLSDKQKDALNHLGDNTGGALQQALTEKLGEAAATQVGQMVSTPLNAVGQTCGRRFAPTPATSSAATSLCVSPSIWVEPSRQPTAWPISTNRRPTTTSD